MFCYLLQTSWLSSRWFRFRKPLLGTHSDRRGCRTLEVDLPQRYDAAMLSKQLEHMLNGLFKEAKSNGHEFLTVEHLLVGLIDGDDTRRMLEHAGGNIEELRTAMTLHIETTVRKLFDHESETQPAIEFQRVIQRAVFHVHSSGRKEVNPADVLLAVFSEDDGESVAILNRGGIKRIDIEKQMQLDSSLQTEFADLRESTSTQFTHGRESQLDRIEAKLDQTIADLNDLKDKVRRISSRLDSDE